MTLTPDELKHLELGLEAIRADREFKSAIQRDIWRDEQRRSREVSRIRQQLLEKVLKTAGIDPADIARKHEKTNSGAERQRVKLTSKLDEYVPAVARRHLNHIEQLKDLARLKRPPRPVPPPPPGPTAVPSEVIILNQADNVALTVDDGQGTAINTAPWNNTLRTLLTFSGEDKNSFVTCDFSFLHTPTRSGVLHAWTWVAPNGYAHWGLNPGCSGIARVWEDAIASVKVIQLSPSGAAGNEISVPAQVLCSEFHAGYFDFCALKWGHEVIDQLCTFETAMDLLVAANVPVQVIVSIELRMIVSKGLGHLDFKKVGRQINVPAVVLNLY